MVQDYALALGKASALLLQSSHDQLPLELRSQTSWHMEKLGETIWKHKHMPRYKSLYYLDIFRKSLNLF